ncbi:MAG: T9SS type A sorting domain-containing protein [Bacteroidia bacterium]|nr:T9SS type A sorting domain-containing protein [Bacteroidia bacterium]
MNPGSYQLKFVLTILITCILSAAMAQAWMHPPYLTGSKSNPPNFYDIQNAFNTWAKGKVLSKTKGIKQYKRWEWFNGPRVFPSGNLPDPGVNWKEWDNYRAAHQEKSDKSMKGNPDWMSVSPATIPASNDQLNINGMGRINCIAFHPTDVNTLWIGASQGGVWKSSDGGLSWVCLTDEIPVLRVSDIAIDPNNPDIIYIATGDINYVSLNSVSTGSITCYGIGILKSTDGGINWNPTGLNFDLTQLNQTLIRKIIINKAHSNELIAGGCSGIYRSLDGGGTWTQVNQEMIIDMKVNPLRDSTIYAASYFSSQENTNAMVLKSTNFGNTWTELNSGIPHQNKVVRTELAVTPADTSVVYAFSSGVNNGFYALYRTSDGGMTWNTVAARDTVANPGASHAPNVLGWADGGYFNLTFLPPDEGGQGTYDLTIVADPNDANKIFTGGVNIWGSNDGGHTWNFASMWEAYFGPSVHADQHYSIYHPITGQLYQSHDGGIDKTANIQLGNIDTVLNCINFVTQQIDPNCYDLPTDWTNISNGLHITEFYRLALCKTDPDIIVAGCQDNGTYMYKNGSWLNILGGDGMEAMIDYTNADIIYATNYNGALSKSTNGGLTFTSGLETPITNAGETGDWVTPFVMHPFNPQVIYAGFNNVWKSTDGGSSWTKLSQFNTTLNIIALAVAGSNPDYIYFARQHTAYVSKDAGLTWQLISQGLPVTDATITYIAVSKNNPEVIWVTFSGFITGEKVYRSDDAGLTWQNISADLPNVPANCIVSQEATINGVSNAIYVGTDLGVFYTNDSVFNSATPWTYYSDGLPKVIVNELEINYVSQKLVAATYGRGLWEASLYSPSDLSGIEPINKLQTGISINPNPNNGIFTLKVNAKSFSQIKIDVFTLSGDKLQSYTENTKGSFSKEIDVHDLPSGVYLVKVSIDGSIFTQKITKL